MMEVIDFTGDRISGLPDLILTHILSFLPTEEAVCTCILSKRWMKVWASLPVLVFDDHKNRTKCLTEEEIRRCEAKFLRFLGGVIFHRENLTLDTFKLTWWGNDRSTHYLVFGFLCCAVMFRPRVLSIDMETCTFLNMPDSIFTCTSIEEMSLSLETDDVFHEYNFLQMRSINLPFLKNLELGRINLNDDIMKMFISGCPVLEELVLKDCWMKLSMISSNVLKKLALKYCLQSSPLEISCPGVVSLIIMSMHMSGIILKNMASLATADISFTDDDVSDFRILGGLSNVTSLNLETDVMDVLLADIPNCPSLKNLRSLELGKLDFHYDWNLVACLLQHSTNLKDLKLHLYRLSEDDTEDTEEEFQDDISFRHDYLEAVKVCCPGKTVKLAGEKVLVRMSGNVETTARIIIS